MSNSRNEMGKNAVAVTDDKHRHHHPLLNIIHRNIKYLEEVQNENDNMMLQYEGQLLQLEYHIKHYQRQLHSHYEELEQVHDTIPVWVNIIKILLNRNV